MAIPGSRDQGEIKGKVRIGEKRTSARGNEYPASVDYFRSDEPEFAAVVGAKPKMIRICFLSDAPEVAFRTGLNWWVKKRGADKPTLACYTEESGSSPVALRVEAYLDRDDAGEVVNEARGEKVGAGRVPITCTFRDCPHFKSRDCRPIGRLDFYLADDPDKYIWRIDTKSWNSIEGLEYDLAGYDDLTDRVFELSVAFQTKGDKKFPVLAIQEADPMDVDTPKDVAEADALVSLANRYGDGSGPEPAKKAALATYLDETMPGWRERLDVIDRIQTVGVDAAITKLLEKARS